MAENSRIEWTDATFNPWIGCTRVSAGCDNCYAAAQDKFRGWTPEGWEGPRKRTSVANWRKPLQWNALPFYQCAYCGQRGAGADFTQPCRSGVGGLHWLQAARRRVFCASLADVFDNEVPPAWRADLFDLITRTPNLDWLLLTKRIGNVRHMLVEILRPDTMPANVWLGATVVNQEEADRDIPKLLATPARVRFLSMEPLLGPVEFSNVTRRADAVKQLGRPALAGIDWVIAGGESGPHARPAHPDWFRSLRDQCAAVGVAFFHKQNGEWASVSEVAGVGVHHQFPDGATVRRVGKKAAGRLLDGVTHDGFPEVPHG